MNNPHESGSPEIPPIPETEKALRLETALIEPQDLFALSAALNALDKEAFGDHPIFGRWRSIRLRPEDALIVLRDQHHEAIAGYTFATASNEEKTAHVRATV